MRVFGMFRSSTGEVRLAPTGEKPAYRPREMSEEKRADINACLACTRKVCRGCVSSHENKYSKKVRTDG